MMGKMKDIVGYLLVALICTTIDDVINSVGASKSRTDVRRSRNVPTHNLLASNKNGQSVTLYTGDFI